MKVLMTVPKTAAMTPCGPSSGFILAMMNLRTSIHMHHLSTDSYSKHVALNEFYDELTDLADKYAETYMGRLGQIAVPVESSYAIPELLSLPDVLINEVGAARLTVGADSMLSNILDEIEGLACRIKYKLQYLK